MGGEAYSLEGFMNANRSMQEHRQAISGYLVLIDKGAVSWCSKKQELVTLSTTESEYIATTHAIFGFNVLVRSSDHLNT